MTLQRKAEILAAVTAVCLAGCFLRAWVLEREYRIRAEVTSAAAEQTVANREAQIADRDAKNGKLTAQLSAQSDALKTAPQAVKVIERYLPAPIATPIPVVNRTDLPPAIAAELPPDASPQATVGILTDKQLVQLGKDELACDATRHELLTCQADAVDLRAVIAAKTAEVDTWKTAAKGGTKLQRVGRVLKVAACAGAGAGVAKLFQPTYAGVAIGASAGAAACSLF